MVMDPLYIYILITLYCEGAVIYVCLSKIMYKTAVVTMETEL